MAYGSQHHVQIMEDQTRFNLNQALVAWRAELAGQPGISVENARELETHLLESFSTFKRRGLNDPEAFLKARQQLGNPGEVGAEFAKDNILRVWRDRVFWITFAGFLMAVFFSAACLPTMHLAIRVRDGYGKWAAAAVYSVLNGVPVLVAALLFATGRIQLLFSKVSWLFASRWRLGIAGLLLAVAANVQSFRVIGAVFIYELGFLGFALVMMPREMLAALHVKAEGAGDWRSSIGLWRDRLFWIAMTQLAIGAWNAAVSLGITMYLYHLPVSERSAPPFISGIVYFSAWLIPMAVVGIVLVTARLSRITRMLQSRRSVLVAGTVLVLIQSCLMFWTFIWTFNFGFPSIHMSPADWRSDMFSTTVSSLLEQAGFIAAMLWLVRLPRRLSAVEVA